MPSAVVVRPLSPAVRAPSALGLILVGLASSLVGCTGRTVTLVELTLSPSTVPSAGDHYELFATVPGGAVSVGRFAVVVVDPRTGIDTSAAIKAAVDVNDPARRFGYLDGISPAGAPIGGIALELSADLSAATDLFITREPDGDTDPTPTRDAIAECPLEAGGRGTLACTLRRPGDKTLVVGTAALVLPSDALNGL
jgi:hypothetical protein